MDLPSRDRHRVLGVVLLRDNPRTSTTDLRAVVGCRKNEITPFLDQMVDDGLIRREPGLRGAVLWSLASAPVPDSGNGSSS